MKFFNKIDKIDKFVENDSLSINLKKDLFPLFKDEVIKRYFFNKISELSDTRWLKELNEFIIKNSTSIPKEEPWPESQYLARMASHSPDEVLKIIRNMNDTDNFYVHGDILDAAYKMPEDKAVQLLEIIIKGISKPSVNWNFQKYSGFIIKLAESNCIDEAINLTSVLLQLKLDLENTKPPTHYYYGADPIPKFDGIYYKNILEPIVPVLTKYAKIKALELFCNIYVDAINFMKKTGIEEDNDPTKHYSLYIESFEDFEHQGHTDTPIYNVFWAIRTTAEKLMKSNAKEVLKNIAEHDFIIFKRLELYLRWKYPKVDISGTKSILSNPEIYTNEDFETEINHLLPLFFDKLSSKEKQEYFDYVDKPIEKDGSFSQDEYQQIENKLRLKRLKPIEKYLKGKRKKDYETLKKEYAKLQQSDRSIFGNHVGFRGFKTPKTKQELVSMPFDEMVEYFRPGIKKGGTPQDHEILEGYARIFETLADENSEQYASRAEQFIGLPPACVDGIIRGLRNSLDIRNNFCNSQWLSILNLCKWVVDQDRNKKINFGYYGSNNPGWGWTRKTITDLFDKSLKKPDKSIPFNYKDDIWYILKILTKDPNPEADDTTDSLEPFTQTINTVRGTAMIDVFHFIRWRNHNLDIKEGFNQIPELKECLEKHLDEQHEKTITVRSAYGVYFNTLLVADEKWTTEYLDKIFPCQENQFDVFNAVFSSYIKFNRPTIKAFSFLKNKYAFALNHLSDFDSKERGMQRADERLSEHLMVLYWFGEIEIDESLNILQTFYKNASDSLRAHAFSFIGRSLQNTTEPIPDDVIDRLKSIWKYRLEEAKESDKRNLFENEIGAIGSWFVAEKFSDDEWLLDQVEEALKTTGFVEEEHEVIEKLAKISGDYPIKCLSCLEMIVEKPHDQWVISYKIEDIKTLLKTVLRCGDKKAEKKALDLVNTIASKGYIEQMRELLE